MVNSSANPMFADSSETVFDYRSAFKYTKVAADEDVFCDNSGDNQIDDPFTRKNSSLVTDLVHKSIVIFFYSLFIITFPVSAFFCIRRIQPLQRCLVYRLGIRLPLKGPGLVIKLPLIDCIEVIDLSESEFNLVDDNQQLMTADGSILEFHSFVCSLNVVNAVRSSTQLKDAKFNVKTFCKLSFFNMIAGLHVEDLENKTDSIIKDFEQNCNIYLNNWGYNCKLTQIPKFVVLSRANPINPVLTKLKSMFSGQPDGPNGLMAELMKHTPKPVFGITSNEKTELSSKQIEESLEVMASKYSKFVFHDITIGVQVIDSDEYFNYSHSTGKVTKLSEKPNKINISIIADSTNALKMFCINQDMQSVRISTNLM